MRMYDLIVKKKRGEILSEEEIKYMVNAYVGGEIPDYQMAAFLMAVYFQGMNGREILDLTMAVAHSGDMVDLSAIEGIKVDKHSTGGVGDKTTLIVAPIAAACGLKVAKMSGKGLGHTGGTIDKLESIPGMQTSLEREDFFRIVNRTGLSVIGQSGNLAPGDKKLYALRDVTATVDSTALIASSIMSKKLAAGSDCIVLDVKTGSGAFMKTAEEAVILAKTMVEIGENAGKRTIALITDMDIPLGNSIGNSLEVIEAVEVLQGGGAKDLSEVSRQLAANMLFLGEKGDMPTCEKLVEEAIGSKRALEKLIAMIEAQGGDGSVITNTGKFEKAKYNIEVIAEHEGYISHMDTESIGRTAVILGAGREEKDSAIDYSAGIILHKKYGDRVSKGEVLASLYANEERLFAPAKEKFISALSFSEGKPYMKPLILARVSKDGVERFDR